MLKEMKWDVAYKRWKECSYSLPNTLNEPVSVKTIFTEYNQDGIDEIRSAKSTAQLLPKNLKSFPISSF